MEQTCVQCRVVFKVTDEEKNFIKKVSPTINSKLIPISLPNKCFDCRLQNRLAHRNEKTLYHRKCDKTGRQIIALYDGESPYTIYDQKEWWKDDWSPLDYGQKFDFNHSFFSQFSELQKKVPRMSLQQEYNENSDYTTNVSHLKNCYLLFSSDFNQDCCYGIWIERSRDCFDNFMIDQCELAYECVYSNNIYKSSFIYFSSNCQNSTFLVNCRNCRDCFMCSNLRNKQYCILNKQYTKEEYQKKMSEFPLSSHKNLEKAKKRFADIKEDALEPYIRSHGKIINSTGDFLSNTENCHNCYELMEGKDCRNAVSAFKVQDIMDCNHVHGELGYMNSECFPTPYRSAFNMNCYTGNNLYYCDMCMSNTQDCFGCVSLKKGRYCILNKQYTKEEYETLVPQIIEHMKKTGEWGQFFPVEMSLFGYNETEAYQSYPLNEIDIKQKKWMWHQEEKKSGSYMGPQVKLADDINDISNDICSKILICSETNKPYKVIPQEVAFLKKMNIALPRKCSDQRHLKRMKERNKRQLHRRECSECNLSIQTTQDANLFEKVYCEKCYLEAIN